MAFDPMYVKFTCVTLPKDHCVQVSQKYIKVSGYSDPLFKNLKNLNLTPSRGHWPLDDLWPHVSWGHKCDPIQGSMCPSPMEIHQWMWIQWSILQNYHILHTTYTHTMYGMSDHIGSYWLSSGETIWRMRTRTPVRQAFSYGIRHRIRHTHCDSMSYDQMQKVTNTIKIKNLSDLCENMTCFHSFVDKSSIGIITKKKILNDVINVLISQTVKPLPVTRFNKYLPYGS